MYDPKLREQLAQDIYRCPLPAISNKSDLIYLLHNYYIELFHIQTWHFNCPQVTLWLPWHQAAKIYALKNIIKEKATLHLICALDIKITTEKNILKKIRSTARGLWRKANQVKNEHIIIR